MKKRIIFLLIVIYCMFIFTQVFANNIEITHARINLAENYKVYGNNECIAVVSNLKENEIITKDLAEKNGLKERYKMYLPIYIGFSEAQIENANKINEAIIFSKGVEIVTEKKIPINKVNGSFEIELEQLVGIPKGVGMFCEVIYNNGLVNEYDISWIGSSVNYGTSKLKTVIINETKANLYDSIYNKISLKEYRDVYKDYILMSNQEIRIAECYITAKYDVVMDISQTITKGLTEQSPITPIIPDEKPRFSDVPKDNYYYEMIEEMAKNNILNGYEDGTFKPNENITRAEASKIVVKYFNIQKNFFAPIIIKDVQDSHWAKNYIDQVVEYIPLYEDEEFKPEKAITREEFINAIILAGDLQNTVTDSELFFSDIYDLDEISIKNILIAKELEIVNGYGDGTFGPHDNLTRAQACAILSRVNISQ